jgi:hypothetical protein
LKKAILHRKNALFYKTQNGAHVGDVCMSLIHKAELNGISAFEYLVALQRHDDEIAANPSEWMPWNYQATLARLGKPAADGLNMRRRLRAALYHRVSTREQHPRLARAELRAEQEAEQVG